jgi:hypothetical protein
MIDKTLLMSNNDIPFVEAQINIHNPTIKEISLISEENFHLGVGVLNFNRVAFLSEEDEKSLSSFSNFEIFMTIMKEDKKVRLNVTNVLTLLFPNYQIKVQDKDILLLSENGISRIDAFNYDIFKEYLIDIFCLRSIQIEGQYNPSDGLAGKIAKKLQERQKKLAKIKGENESSKNTNIYNQYISILAVGEHKDINTLMNYTVYQLNDEFNRFQLKEQNDLFYNAKINGCTGMEEPENWMKEL